jgi:hypothetical protein
MAEAEVNRRTSEEIALNVGRRMVDEFEAAEILGVSVHQMRRWRALREGPRYRKVGRRVCYQLADLDAYITSLPAAGGREVA